MIVRIRAAHAYSPPSFAAAIASCSTPQTIDVTMIDYRFMPDRLSFEHDVHYRLHLENHGTETHEFTAPTFFATADFDNPDVLNQARTEMTPRRPGTYDLKCVDPDWAGMVGGITVQ